MLNYLRYRKIKQIMNHHYKDAEKATSYLQSIFKYEYVEDDSVNSFGEAAKEILGEDYSDSFYFLSYPKDVNQYYHGSDAYPDFRATCDRFIITAGMIEQLQTNDFDINFAQGVTIIECHLLTYNKEYMDEGYEKLIALFPNMSELHVKTSYKFTMADLKDMLQRKYLKSISAHRGNENLYTFKSKDLEIKFDLGCASFTEYKCTLKTFGAQFYITKTNKFDANHIDQYFNEAEPNFQLELDKSKVACLDVQNFEKFKHFDFYPSETLIINVDQADLDTKFDELRDYISCLPANIEVHLKFEDEIKGIKKQIEDLFLTFFGKTNGRLHLTIDESIQTWLRNSFKILDTDELKAIKSVTITRITEYNPKIMELVYSNCDFTEWNIELKNSFNNYIVGEFEANLKYHTNMVHYRKAGNWYWKDKNDKDLLFGVFPKIRPLL